MKIWCVEDDSSIRDIEVYTLNSTGFAARGFADGAAKFAGASKKASSYFLCPARKRIQ